MEVTEDDFALVSRAAFDCIPEARMRVIRALRDGVSPYSTGLADALVYRTLEDLKALGLAEQTETDGSSQIFTRCAQELLAGADVTSPKMHMNATVVDSVTSQIGGS
jgi:hypothetical protein